MTFMFLLHRRGDVYKRQVGVQGDARTAVETYLRGELISTGSICHNHEHADECGEHH